MHVVVLGAGVVGVTLAYVLAKRGYDVEVVDRQSEPAAECSFANGGQLSYSHAEPWANPGALKKAMKWIGRDDKPLVFKPRLDLEMWLWSLKFLQNCTTAKAYENTVKTLRLGLYSRDIMHEIVADSGVEFSNNKDGILHIFTDKRELPHAIEQADMQVPLGAPYSFLSPEQCLEKDPQLYNLRDTLCGGIFYEGDEGGDVHAFTVGLREKAEAMGVKFHFDTDIYDIVAEGNKITSISTSAGEITADSYAMAMGAYSGRILQRIGIKLPIYPMKGYSISIKTNGSENVPTVASVTHQVDKVVFSMHGDILRVAGTAEFAGYNHDISKPRIDLLKHTTRQVFPNCGDIDNADEWACLRPQIPDGGGILGKCRYSNLYLNTGHGTLGWTMAAGSAKIVADIMEGKTPDIDMDGLTVDRYL